jgi:hypothetical protein
LLRSQALNSPIDTALSRFFGVRRASTPWFFGVRRASTLWTVLAFRHAEAAKTQARADSLRAESKKSKAALLAARGVVSE